jgi:hypothetical protein
MSATPAQRAFIATLEGSTANMPYITKERREAVSRDGSNLLAETAGELNYQITECITDYLRGAVLNYQLINDVIGALEGAKLEFVRRIVNPYEDGKKELNGDVY